VAIDVLNEPGDDRLPRTQDQGKMGDVEIGRGGLALRHLLRAEAALLLLRALPPDASDREKSVARCERDLRLAEVRLAENQAANMVESDVPSGKSASEWLAALREQLAAARAATPPPETDGSRPAHRRPAARDGRFAEAFATGVPAVWRAATPAGGAIERQLLLGDAGDWVGPLGRTIAWVFGVAAWALLAAFAGDRGRPETLVVLGGLGLLAYGLPGGVAFAGLALAGVIWRVATLARRG
jgi:hypothetical protein